MDQQTQIQRAIETLDIRSETSYSEIGLTKRPSIDSMEVPHQEISDTIEEIIGEEKNKYGTSKTDKKIFKE